MPTRLRPQQHRLKWPPSPEQWEAIDDMFEALFRGQRTLDRARSGTGIGEVPAGSIDGSNTVFQTAQAYAWLSVYLNGVRQTVNDDYTETTTTTFTFATAPASGDVVTVDYGAL